MFYDSHAGLLITIFMRRKCPKSWVISVWDYSSVATPKHLFQSSSCALCLQRKILPFGHKRKHLGILYSYRQNLVESTERETSLALAKTIHISDKNNKHVEMNTSSQANGSGFFRHRVGRIGASVSGAAFHSNSAQLPQSLIKTICYPNLFKVNTQAVRHGSKHEEDAIKAYHDKMKASHVNFELKRCRLFINQHHLYLHATPDFLTSCDCCVDPAPSD